MPDYNAREYMSSTFLKKADLRAGGPRRLQIKEVEEGEGLPGRNGQPAKKELQLVFADDTRMSLRAVTNTQRLVEWFGERTSQWVGQVVEAYFSPDVNNPGGGEPGGIRLRLPDAAAKTSVFTSDLKAEMPANSGTGRRGKARGVA